MKNARHTEAAFETIIEAHLLQNGYQQVIREGFDRERAIFPETVLAFIRETQPREWTKLETLHGDKTGEQILGDLCKWMDANGALATLRHGFKCYGRTLHAAFFKGSSPLFGCRPAVARPGRKDASCEICTPENGGRRNRRAVGRTAVGLWS